MDYAWDISARVLVDTGSSLNVMPNSILVKLSYEGIVMRPSLLIEKVFDGYVSSQKNDPSRWLWKK